MSERPEPYRLSHTLVNAFLEGIPDMVYFKDLDSRFIAVSRSKARRHGYSDPSELVGKSDADFFTPEHADHTRRDEAEIMSTGQPALGKLERIGWADGRVSWASSSKLPLRDRNGHVIGTFGLSEDVTQARQIEESLERAQRELLDASRTAGMAEVATGVLHNVGNVLNSLNVSADMIAATLRQSKVSSLEKLPELLRTCQDEDKARLIPQYLAFLARNLEEERAQLLAEVESFQANLDHVKEIVSMQQSYATMAGVIEPLAPEQLMEDALRMNAAALIRHDVRVVRDFAEVPRVRAERGKVLQILINLIRNAKYAIDDQPGSSRELSLGIASGGPGFVRMTVKDAGVGISPEHLAKLFAHGFTTRPDGHGFGLHSSALAASEMGGALAAESGGPAEGASFHLELPIFVCENRPERSPE